MNRLRYILSAFLLMAGMLGGADAQTTFKEKVVRLGHRIDSVQMIRYWRPNIDTNYVIRPQTKWTVTGRFNLSGAQIVAKGQKDGYHSEAKMTADFKSTFNVSVSYMGLTLGFSLNPAKMFGKYHDYELGFRSYGRRFGFDIAYQDAHNFKGWTDVRGDRKDVKTTSEDVFRLRTLNVNAYYVFSPRRFSYPAAFSHSYIQRRSAGSFLLAASGQGQHGKVNAYGRSMDFKMTNIGIGAGYGYNYVPARGWLLHLSTLPTLIVYSNTSLDIDDTSLPLHYHFPEVIITARGAIVKQIGRNKFAGLSAVYSYSRIGHKESLYVRNRKWLVHLYFGFRF